MSSRNIADLSRELQPLCSKFINEANVKLAPLGASIIITCTYRSDQEQERLYAIGRTVSGRKVTNARAGQSRHNSVDAKTGKPAAEAFDIAILVDGKLNWDLASGYWQIAGEVGVSLGLEWGGNWKRFREGPHFQLPGK